MPFQATIDEPLLFNLTDTYMNSDPMNFTYSIAVTDTDSVKRWNGSLRKNLWVIKDTFYVCDEMVCFRGDGVKRRIKLIRKTNKRFQETI